MEIRKLTPLIGAEIIGLDLSKPVRPDVAKTVRDAFDQAGVAVFRDQNLTKQNLVDASAILGEIELHPIEAARDVEEPKMTIISAGSSRLNVEYADGDRIVGRNIWHNDLGYVTKPCRGAIMYGVKLPPEGGETGFIDTALAYDTLDEATQQRIEGLHLNQSWKYAMTEPTARDNPQWKNKDGSISPDFQRYIDKFPDVIYPMVTRHPVTGRKLLNVPLQWAADIVELPGREGWELIDRLTHHLAQKKFVYWHKWQQGDVVAWDNWRTNHGAAGSKAKYGRTMWRTTLRGDIDLGKVIPAGQPSTSTVWRETTVPPFVIPS